MHFPDFGARRGADNAIRGTCRHRRGKGKGQGDGLHLINIYGGGRHRRRHNGGADEGVTEIYQLFLRYIIFFPLICNIILKHYHYGKSKERREAHHQTAAVRDAG